MQPIAETIISWENSDNCALRVLAFAIKFFGSLILITSLIGICPWICAHEEYVLQNFERRVQLLPPPAQPGQAAAPDPREEQINALSAQVQRLEGDLQLSEQNRAKAGESAARENHVVIDQIYKKHEAALAQAKQEVRKTALEEAQKAHSGDMHAAEDKIRELAAEVQKLQQANDEFRGKFAQLAPSQQTSDSLAAGWEAPLASPKGNAQPGTTAFPTTPHPQNPRSYAELAIEVSRLNAEVASLKAAMATDNKPPNTDSLHFNPQTPSNALRHPPLRSPTDEDARNVSGRSSRNTSSPGPTLQLPPHHKRTDTVKMDPAVVAKITGGAPSDDAKKS